MDFYRYALVVAVSFSFSGLLCLSAGQNSSKFSVASGVHSEPVKITNATLDFVAKVFQRFSENNTQRMTVDDFSRLLETLKIGQVFDVSGHAEHVDKNTLKKLKAEGQDDHNVHRRSVESQNVHGKKLNYHYQRFHNNCLSKDRLLEIHHISKNKVLAIDDFIQLCPSLVYEVQSGSCWHDPESVAKLKGDGVTLLVWAYGIASITVISLSTLLAIAVIPCLGKAVYSKVMSFLVALAVGTLAGDAFLHLIPHAFLRGVHEREGHDEDHANPLWKGVAIMSGIYLFFMIESFMKARMSQHQHQHEKEEKPQLEERCGTPLPNDPLVNSTDMVNHNNCSPRDCDEANRQTKGGFTSPSADSTYMTDLSQSDAGLDSDGVVQYNESITVIENKTQWKPPSFFPDDIDGTVLVEKGSHIGDSYSYTTCDPHHCHNTSQLSPPTDVSVGESLDETDKPVVMDDHHHGHHHHEKSIDKNTSVATVAWMVIVGDGFHNLSDGLAVGAAFSSSITTGLTTAIAVLCHELPHELGDFAILIKSGISFRQAIAYNLASAFISYIGLVIGMGLGNLDTSHVWVLALTSGLFLYISLVSMLPELKVYQEKGGFTVFLSQNAGILTGILIMLIIALFEKH
ncbi:zinc transporter ZIP14 [Exaiptasia diaphana]|uniref:EF-hand domain-containing protein n=1 Tax=Exaiptasia diaphana TaxID=2652724 RepID=A0A913XXB9_EXADI|nr:zinc transporter ZIP14 [Exaiptasia diaphana]XP_020911293.1 zinc transporter ZIP14 [Exaiptasia diaphana]KXJ08254.1 Zinc transporter ZIP10 [Exaiptasia diaphana]